MSNVSSQSRDQVSVPTKNPTKFDAAMVARLERLYASPQAIAQRTRFRELLAARPGEIGLDVGCGLGHLACELALEVAPDGQIIGIDTSHEMVNAAKTRVEREGLDHCVEARPGDAAALDIANESVDFAVAVQVYSYVHEIERAVQEATRVLRKGGRLAVLETDWDMCTYESQDPALTRRVLDGRWRFAHSHLPRQLHRFFRASGLMLVRADVFPIFETLYDPESFGASLVDIARDAAVRHGIDAAKADAWARDIHSRSNDGDYFFCANRFIFVAQKSDAS